MKRFHLRRCLFKKGFVFLLDIEAWTCFCNEFSVPVYGSERKALVQILQELHEGFLLRLSSCIFRCLAIPCNAPDITDTDTVGVVLQAVRSDLCERSACVYTSIAIDHEVISDVLELSSDVPSPDVINRVVASLLGRATMDNNFFYCTHGGESLELRDES